VLMEAMAAGLPVISTRVSGIPELIEAGLDGLLVEERDAEALADAIEELLMDEGLYERLKIAAQAKIEKEFSIESSSQALARLFRGQHENHQ
jgi:colanic acid/amylovoran biosynthesis glycosyltransferase